MAYAVAADIISEFKALKLDGSTSIKTAEVTEFITQEEAAINATIGNRYEVPVVDTESVEIMKKISIACVAYRVAKILNLKKDIPIAEKLVVQVLNEGSWFKVAKKQLEDIQSGKIVLSGAVALSSNQGVNSYNAENAILPIWKRNTKQW